MTQQWALLSDADYTLMEPSPASETLQQWAQVAGLDPRRVMHAVRVLEHKTGQGAYAGVPEAWLADVIALAGGRGLSPDALRQLLESLADIHARRLVPYPCYPELMAWAASACEASAVVSGKGFISRDATRSVLAGFDRYGFSCDDWRWSKDENPHAYSDMLGYLLGDAVATAKPRTIVLEDNHHFALNAKRDGIGVVIVILHRGGVAAEDLGNDLLDLSTLTDKGLVVVKDLREATAYLRGEL